MPSRRWQKLVNAIPRPQAFFKGETPPGRQGFALTAKSGATMLRLPLTATGKTDGMKPPRPLSPALLALVLAASACDAQSSGLVVSSDPELAAVAEEVLADIADRAGMTLTAPVRLEVRSRADLETYVLDKLERDLPQDEADARVEVYARLGLVDADLDLRALLVGLYGEQVAGFYEPDSTAFFLIDDQPPEGLRPLLAHELVHAVQDQNTDLSALIDPDVGNDRATAAMAAIEGQATLVMLEYMTEQMSGTNTDLSIVQDFAAQVRPALEMTAQFPALAAAPRIIRESLLFPYVDGAIFAHGLWTGSERRSPFGAALPLSTEQVYDPSAAPPVQMRAQPGEGVETILEDDLGSLELGIFAEDVLGASGPGRAGGLVDGWDGDRYLLARLPDGSTSLAIATLWADEPSRDRFAAALESNRDALGADLVARPTRLADRAALIFFLGPVFEGSFAVLEGGAG